MHIRGQPCWPLFIGGRMVTLPEINYMKYTRAADSSYFRKMGKVVNLVGLTVESAGPDAKLGDLCRIYPEGEGVEPIMAEVVGFKDKKTLLMPYEETNGIGAGCGLKGRGGICQRVGAGLASQGGGPLGGSLGGREGTEAQSLFCLTVAVGVKE